MARYIDAPTITDAQSSVIQQNIDDKSAAFDPNQTIDEYFKLLNQKTEEYKEQYEKLMNEAYSTISNNYKDRMELATKDIIRNEAKIRSSGLKDAENLAIEYRKNAEFKLKKQLLKEEIANLKEFQVFSNKETKKQRKQQLKEELAENRQLIKDLLELKKQQGGKLDDEQQAQLEQAQKDVTTGVFATQLEKFGKQLGSFIKDVFNEINSTISTFSSYQQSINTRLQGANISTSALERAVYGGSNYFGILENRLSAGVGITPFFKTEDLMTSLQDLVAQGIASNVDQRAFLQVVSKSIANTFDAADASLLRIVRLQQSDSTALRLGMEAYLTQFLNELVQNTEYLNSTFDSVASALTQASSLMSAAESTEFEYVVQKWLGSLTGVGLSESTATNIANAISYLSSGDINNLTSSSVSNLLIMAASRAGLNYSEMLTNGLNAYTTNALLEGITKYMSELYDAGNNVVRAQYASTFGVDITDLKAAKNISDSVKAIADNLLSSQDMYNTLADQLSFGSMFNRIGTAGMLSNVISNTKYSLASNIASTPALAALWSITDLIQNVTGGINIPTIGAFGAFIDMETTVENLMKLGLVGVSSLGMIGDIISGIGSTANPNEMLRKLKINDTVGAILAGESTLAKGKGLSGSTSGMSTSIETYQGNSDSGTLYESTLAASKDTAQKEYDQKVDETTDYTKKLDEFVENTINEKLESILGSLTTLNNTLILNRTYNADTIESGVKALSNYLSSISSNTAASNTASTIEGIN